MRNSFSNMYVLSFSGNRIPVVIAVSTRLTGLR